MKGLLRRLHRRNGTGRRQLAGFAVFAALGLAAAACSSSPAASGGSSDGHVTISVDCAPPASSPKQHKEWLEDVALFEKQNPNITINSIFENPCEVPASFTAMLRAGNEPNVFYTYFTDKNQVLDAGQAADITSYVNSTTVPVLKDIVPTAMAAVTAGKTLYGLPTVNYTQGLIINRKLFQQAGLNPDQPPTTWAEVEADAKAITKLGHGIYGYGDYSAGNNGGWHFSSEIDAEGGEMINRPAPGRPSTPTRARPCCRRCTRCASSTTAWARPSSSPGAPCRSRWPRASSACTSPPPTTSPTSSSRRTAATSTDYGMGPLPSTSGTPAGSLSGGNDYMFAKHDTPAQIRAGIKWLVFENLTPGVGFYNYARQKADGFPVGFPEPQDVHRRDRGQAAAGDGQERDAVPDFFSTFTKAHELAMGEPPTAQAVYKTLDPVDARRC